LGRLQALGDHVAHEEEPLLGDEAEHQRLRALLLVRAPLLDSRKRKRPFARAAAVAAAAALFGAAWFWRHSPEHPLRFFVGPGHAQGTLGEFVSALDAPVPVTFSDATKVVFEPGARGRVLSTGAHGADVVVESGRARISVVPRAGNQWMVSTGPFVVQVTGTRFDVEWHPDRDAFVLELHEGHVRIAGCAFAGGHAVNPGERVEAACKEGAFRVSRVVETHAVLPSANGPDVEAPAAALMGGRGEVPVEPSPAAQVRAEPVKPGSAPSD